MAQEVVVRRAKPGDAERIATFVNQAWQGRSEFDRQAVMERLGGAGFLLAERGGNLVGMLGWRTENLVVRVTDFLIWPASERTAAGQALFSEMEQAAVVLRCEVAVLFPPRPVSSQLIEFCKTLGYESRVVASLARAWREAAREARMEDYDLVLIKQLRADLVLRPM
jgi:N-acetylglutamate synthase-like GNAT family acetyltransferase